MSAGCGCGQSRAVGCETEFQYAVKVVCGTLPVPTHGAAGGPLAPGLYYTAINIHNPSKCDTVAFRYKVAQALPAEQGTVTLFHSLSLGPDGAMEIDNPQVLKAIPRAKFLKGYVVIESPEELDVVAVYSVAQGATSPAHSFFTERVPARCVPVCEDLVLPISTGVADWQAVISPHGSPPGPVYQLTSLPGPWVAPPAGSVWVSAAAADSYSAPASPPAYTYQLCFNLCSGFSNPDLQMQGIADDSATVSLNGHLLGSTSGLAGPPATIPSPAANLFVVGQNCLTVAVTNLSGARINPTGFALAGLLRVTGGRCPCAKLPVLTSATLGK